MSADSPREGLRLLATLIAADLRAGGSALVEVPAETEAPRRGRKPTKVAAVAAQHPIARAA